MRLWLVAMVAWGCARPVEDDDPAPVESGEVGVTYHADVRPIVEARCQSCHIAGGVAPFSTAYEGGAFVDPAESWFAPSTAAVESGSMPPWSPADDCHPIEHARTLSDAERDLFAEWAAAGHPEGDPASYPGGGAVQTEEPDDLGEPTLVLRSAVPYTPDPMRPDDYRCFVVETGQDTERWIAGFDVQPDRVDLVHHVILYGLEPEYADDVVQWDAQDPGPGYGCFGSPGTWDAETIGGWAPGQAAEVYAPGTARRLQAGTQLVVQVHYNTVNAATEIGPEQSEVRLWLLDEGETPRQELISLPFADLDLNLPPGDPNVVEEEEIDLGFLFGRVPIRGAFPHMHQLGTRIRLDAVAEDGSEQCVIDIPRWDFNWQQTYFFPETDPVLVSREDTLRLSCTYDNSAANQPVVNGEQLEPRQVEWGDGSLDEMCLVYVYVTRPVVDF